MDVQFLIELAMNYWYFGIFLIGFLSSASLFLPVPTFVLIFALSQTFDPLLLGIIAGAGAAVGELVAYALGYGGKELFLKKHEEKLKVIEKSFKKYHPALVIFVFAVTPLPFDIIAILCGVIKYPLKKFFLPLLLGKVIKYLFITYAGFYGMQWVSGVFGW